MRYPQGIWSGYQLDLQSFAKFMEPIIGDDDDPPASTFSDLVNYYTWWKNANNFPPETLEKFPEIRCV